MARGKLDSFILAAVVKYHMPLVCSFVCGLYFYGLFFDAHPLCAQIAILLMADVYLAKVSPFLGISFVFLCWFVLEFMYNFGFRLFMGCASTYALMVKFTHPLFYRMLPWLCAHPFCYFVYGPWSIIALFILLFPYAMIFRMWQDEVVKVVGSPLYPHFSIYPPRPSPWQKARPVLYRLVSEALSNLDWVGPFRGGSSENSLSLKEAAWAAAPYMVIGGRLAVRVIMEPGSEICSSLESLVGWCNCEKFDREARESWARAEAENLEREKREAIEQEQRKKEARKRAAEEASRRCTQKHKEERLREQRRLEELRALRAAEARERRFMEQVWSPTPVARKSVRTS